MQLSRFKVLLFVLVALSGLALVTDADALAKGGDEAVLYSPTTEPGATHLFMYNSVGTVCTDCHDGTFADLAPSLKGMKKVNMSSSKKACAECHSGDKAPVLFISLMDTQIPAYGRCEDCHSLK